MIGRFASAARFVCALLLVACTTNAKALDGDPFVRAVRALRPSVVLFTMKIPSDDPKKKGEWDDAFGTGIIVASGPWGSQILTEEHVVRDARDLRATVGERADIPVRVVAVDRKKDVALVETSKPDLPIAPLGSSRGLEPGMAVGVAGFPVPDYFQNEDLGVATSIRAGRISSVRKHNLELDFGIIPGESGGPVFDARTGEVIGLAEWRFEDERAIGFAIPIDDAKQFLKINLHH
jgi:serine protease Do